MPVSQQGFLPLFTPSRRVRNLGERVQEESGFTVIELVVAMLILIIALTSFSVMFVNMQSASNGVVSDTALQTEARSGVDRLIGEFRQAYTAQSAVAPVITMTSTQLTFYVPDESQPYHLLKVGYRLNGGNLQRGFERSTNTGGPPWSWPSPDALSGWETVAESVTGNPGGTSLFQYIKQDNVDANGNPVIPPNWIWATTPVDVNSILVTVTTKGTGRGAAPYTYSAIGTIRGTAFNN